MTQLSIRQVTRVFAPAKAGGEPMAPAARITIAMRITMKRRSAPQPPGQQLADP